MKVFETNSALEGVINIQEHSPCLFFPGGFWHTSLIDKNMVDFFVPFLPLEYKHVVQCGRAEMISKGMEPNDEAVEQMAHDMNYFPRDERVFSMQGCKVISSRLDFYI